MMPHIKDASNLAIKNNIDIAVRYFPYCKLPEFLRKRNFNYITDMFDKNEWNREYWFPKAFKKHLPKLKEIKDKLKLEGPEEQQIHHAFCRTYKEFRMHFCLHSSCKNCSHKYICDMPHKEQVDFFPEQEFKTIEGPIIKNTRYYFN